MQIIQIIIKIICATLKTLLKTMSYDKTSIEIIIFGVPPSPALLVCVLAPAKLAVANIRITTII
jgi:hypothetical protein